MHDTPAPPRPPQRFANYPGDVTHMVRTDEKSRTHHEIVGPNSFGEFMTTMTANYDPATDKTRVGFAYATPTELGQ